MSVETESKTRAYKVRIDSEGLKECAACGGEWEDGDFEDLDVYFTNDIETYWDEAEDDELVDVTDAPLKSAWRCPNGCVSSQMPGEPESMNEGKWVCRMCSAEYPFPNDYPEEQAKQLAEDCCGHR